MKSNIFLPKRIKVGFQNRNDTYSGKLAYVIYYDAKNKLRKETSWNNWRDKKIPDQEFDNNPVEGFVINKKVGGVEESWYDVRKTYVRVYDPRGFEFEITIPNLLWILENCNCIKGKGLEGQFVYGWDGTELVLVPIDSSDYIDLTEKNDIIHGDNFIKTKDLVVGATYETVKGEKMIYMGRFDKWEHEVNDFYDRNRSYSCWGYREEGWRYPIDDTWLKNPFSSLDEQIDRRERWVNKGKFFFFAVEDCTGFRINSYSGIFRSVNRKFIRVVDSECYKGYAELYESLESSDFFSPVDFSKSIIIPYSYDEFESKCKGYFDSHSGRYDYITIHFSTEDKGFVSERLFYNRDEDRYFYTEYRKTSWGRTESEQKSFSSLKDVYDTLNPCKGEEYLVNGKLNKVVGIR